MRTRPLYDVAALLARIGVGVVFIAHGWQKIQVGVTATAHNFDLLGVPVPTAAAVYATFVELLGGAALILGLGLPVAGLLLFADMLGAFIFVNVEHGLFVTDQGMAKEGFELVLVLGLASLLFATGGGGRITLDSRIFPRRTESPGGHAFDRQNTDKQSTGRQARGRLGIGRRQAGGQGAGEPGAHDAAAEPAAAPAKPPAAKPSAIKPPASSADTTTEIPRLAADIVEDTSRDTLVAGRKRPRKPTGGNV
ncbi:DoxX family protein [Actinomadura scrupuli]|uniref:DoxX family protein n=1 Tax=Actinomadura scrupuli TaxID=559629 RepID=UPI003D97A1ED